MNINNGRSKITPTQEQMDAIMAPEPVITVNAVAGSGKTQLLMEIADRHPKGLYLAYSKAMAEEIKPKLPFGWFCKTFAAMGHLMTRTNMPMPRVDFNKHERPEYRGGNGDLANLHMELCGNSTQQSWEATCNRFKIPHLFIDKARETLDEMIHDHSRISGTEMMYWPVMNGWTSPRYPIVLVDEVQDLSPLQLDLIKLIPTDKLVLVGDTKQAIFGFRGADIDAFDRVDNTYNPAHYQLTESFRCPQQIINEVMDFAPAMWSRKTNGYVAEMSQIPYHGLPDDCFIMARHNALVYKTAHQLMQRHVPFSTSSTIVRRLKHNINSMVGKAKDMQEARDNAEKAYIQRKKVFMRYRWKIEELDNEFNAIFTLLNMYNTIPELQSFANKLELTQRSSSKRRLMSIHTAKGLENKNVFLLNPTFYMQKRSGMKQKLSWEQRQEENLFYVGCTRSTKNLSLVHVS